MAWYAADEGSSAMASVYASSADLKSPDLNSALPRSFAASASSVGSAAGAAR